MKFFQNLIRILQEILINIPIRKLTDHGILVKFQLYIDQNYFKELDDQGVPEKFWRIWIRILEAILSIQQFRSLLNSSKIKWPQNSCEVLPGFDQNPSIIGWLWNFFEILGFWSEFWLLATVSNNPDDYEILQKLDDHGNLPGFDQNSDSQNSRDQTLVTSQIWIHTIVDYVSNEIEV